MSTNLSILLIIFSAFFAECRGTGGHKGPKDPGLIQDVTPNFKEVKGLICYQCRSHTSELQPLCDKSMFRLATPQEKYNMSLQCPHYQGAYCFLKTRKDGKHKETIRGCTGSTDKNGNLMKVGCMTTEEEVLCICDKKFCNKGISLSSVHTRFVLMLTLILIII